MRVIPYVFTTDLKFIFSVKTQADLWNSKVVFWLKKNCIFYSFHGAACEHHVTLYLLHSLTRNEKEIFLNFHICVRFSIFIIPYTNFVWSFHLLTSSAVVTTWLTSIVFGDVDFDYLTLEEGTNRLFRNVGKQLPTYAVYHSRRAKVSTTPRRKPEISLAFRYRTL